MNTMKTTQNLTTASNEWTSRPADQRFQDLPSLAAAVTSRRDRSRTLTVDVQELTVKEVPNRAGTGNTLAFNGIMLPTEPNNWSFGQVAAAIKAPAAYLRALPTPLAAQCINHGIANRAEPGPVRLMTQSHEDAPLNTLAALTSTKYGRIWDADCVAAVQRIVSATNGRFYNPPAYAKGKFGAAPEPSGLYASDHDVFMFLVDGGSRLEVGPRAKLNRGFFVFNSEVGAKTLGITTFLFNEVCGNHIVWGASDVNTLLVRHSSGAPARFDREAMPHLLDYVNTSAAPVESAIRKAQEIRLLDLIPAAALVTDTATEDFAKAFNGKFPKFTRSEVREAIAYARREEGQAHSLWDIVQGFTASARELEHMDTRLNLEQRAGALLDIAAERADVTV